jgi:predicted DNA binding CopG/RHH family protein
MKKLFVKEDSDARPLDWGKARVAVFPNLKPSMTPISLRLPDSLLSRLKMKAHKLGVPYQSYIKAVLARDVESI